MIAAPVNSKHASEIKLAGRPQETARAFPSASRGRSGLTYSRCKPQFRRMLIWHVPVMVQVTGYGKCVTHEKKGWPRSSPLWLSRISGSSVGSHAHGGRCDCREILQATKLGYVAVRSRSYAGDGKAGLTLRVDVGCANRCAVVKEGHCS
jgi:hypothetical protein